MASTVTAPLGSKENPHIMIGMKPKKINRISGNWYLFKGNLRYCDNQKRLINKERDKEYRKEKKEEIALRYKNWYDKNGGKVKAKLKRDRKGAKGDLIREKDREKWKNRDKDKVSKQRKKQRNKPENKVKRNKYLRKRKQENPDIKLKCNLRSRISMEIKKSGASKNQHTMEYLNCSVAHLYHHLESQFEPGMTWENYGFGNDKWNIEHRKPCSEFDLTDIEQQYMCFHWTNLQPMWQPENLAKSNSFDQKTFRYKWWGKEIGWLGIPKYLMPNTSL